MDPHRPHIPRDLNDDAQSIPHDLTQPQQDDMVAAPSPPQLPPSNPTSRDANVAKRYRAAPAKTFQCRGYGDCHMVFSRSEHLARHVRKHTGERPFTCHCGKQFSRLDNLRQHAQTVHSDKQDENERMMRELTALHTSMAAAHKATGARGKRSQQHATTSAAAQASSLGMGAGVGSSMNNGVKVEEMQMHRSLSSANYGLGSSIMQMQMQTHRRLTLDLDPTINRSSYSYSPDSTCSSSSAYQLPPTPPITPPTAIPFVTPTSPFATHNPARTTNNTNNTTSNNNSSLPPQPPASPFLPPSPFSPPPQSSHPGARHPLAVGHPLQADPTQPQHLQHPHQQQQAQQHPLFAPPSRPCLPLSPNPSPHPAGSLPYFNYPPPQQAAHADREQHRQPTHISPTGLLSADDLQLEALQVEGWALSQNFPYTEQSWEDPQQQQHQRTSSPAGSESMLTQQHTGTHRARPTGITRAQTTVPFPSTLPRSPTPGQVQAQQQQQQQQQHLAYASGHTATGQSPTMSTAVTRGMMGLQAEGRTGRHPRPPPPPASAASSTTAGPEAGLSLDGSPSWSSAMTPTLQGPLFYHYPAAHDPPPHLAGSSSHPQGPQPHLQSRQQQQPYLQQQHQQQQEARQVDLPAGVPLHLDSMDLEEDYIQQYVAMAQAAQQAYYLSAPASVLPHPHAHQVRFRTDAEAPGPAAHHPPTPTSALTPATAYNSPPAMIKYESPSHHAGALQLLPE